MTASDYFACAFVDKFKSLKIELIDIMSDVSGKENCFEFYFNHISEIYDVYNSLIDESSRKVFRAFLLGNVSSRVSDYIFDEMPQYLLTGFLPKSGDILIDGGASDGSTAIMFRKMGCNVYSFELDPKIFLQTRSLAESEDFTVENFGLSSEYHEDENLKFISIDEYVERQNLPRIDFIKLDIEGFELDTLKGAAVSIARFKPKLALSAYHKPEDIFTLVKFVKSIRPDYEFACRHYATTYKNEPGLFGKSGKDFLKRHNLPTRIPYIWEFDIYAR